MFVRLLLFVVALLAFVSLGEAGIREGECEVCLKVMDDFAAHMKENGIKKKQDILEQIKVKCKEYPKTSREKRLCYYIGGNEDSASGMLREVAQPLSFNMPAKKICEKIKKKDHSICELAFVKEIDVSTVDVSTLRVKELKKILSSWGEECKGCTSKSDFVKLVNDKKAEHAPKTEL